MAVSKAYAAGKPANEVERLQALHDLHVLDTGRDAVLDSLASFASLLFDVPTALVSLVDADRQWFKAKCGMSDSEHPREWSFCAHMVAGNLPVMVVEDARQDPVLADNPLVKEFGSVRFYAGCALRSAEGHMLGSFCLLDAKPHVFSATELVRLKQLAATAETVVRNYGDNRRVSEGLIQRAFYDPVTDLPNRALLRERILGYQTLGNTTDHDVTLALVNPKRFRVLNQSLGWDTGDELLKAIGSRLQKVMPANGMVAHLHEEHFALLAVSSNGASSELLDRVSSVLTEPFVLGGAEHKLDFSIGTVDHPLQKIDNPDSLIERAKQALRQTKPVAGTAIVSLSLQQQSQLAADLSLENRLRLAIENHELELHYQPIVRMTDLKIMGMEALVRWQSDGTWISPGQFIPLAEDVGLIQDLSRWILQTACIEFQATVGKDQACYLSVNVSAHELYAEDFVSRVEYALTTSGLSPHQLCLEVTEHSLIRDIPLAVEQMQRLVDSGVHFAIDDFGTGFASLRYLQLLPIDTLKIDRCFVEGLPHSKTDVAIIRATIAMANSLGLRIVCEGIETFDQMRFLQHEGTTIAQGWYFAKAIPIDQFGDGAHLHLL